MTNWVAGWNMAGYAPDPDNLYVTDDWDRAVSYLAETIEHWWDGDYMVTEGDDDIDSHYIDAHTELHNASTPRPLSVAVTDLRGYMTFLWIEPTDEEPTDE